LLLVVYFDTTRTIEGKASIATPTTTLDARYSASDAEETRRVIEATELFWWTTVSHTRHDS
jgi:hypothetical protein